MIKNLINENKNKYLYVFSDCIPVYGAKNSAVYDLTRRDVHLFPKSYFILFDIFKKNTLGDISHLIADNDKEQFKSFISFLLDNELATFVEDINIFPDIKIEWEKPNMISNSIIDIRDKLHDFESIFNQLDELGCEFVQLRFYSNKYSLDTLNDILNLAYDKSLSSIELLLMYNSKISEEEYLELFEKHQIIASLLIHSCGFDKKMNTFFGYSKNDQQIKNSIKHEIVFTSQQITSCDHCGIINQKYLSVSEVSSYMENVLYNGCLNKKISIDEYGTIKNCPSMKTSYGSVENTILKEVIEEDVFKKYWKINKDSIKECQDCELRYMCTDCRAYTKNPDDLFSKPQKCDYDPYSGTWK